MDAADTNRRNHAPPRLRRCRMAWRRGGQRGGGGEGLDIMGMYANTTNRRNHAPHYRAVAEWLGAEGGSGVEAVRGGNVWRLGGFLGWIIGWFFWVDCWVDVVCDIYNAVVSVLGVGGGCEEGRSREEGARRTAVIERAPDGLLGVGWVDVTGWRLGGCGWRLGWVWVFGRFGGLC